MYPDRKKKEYNYDIAYDPPKGMDMSLEQFNDGLIHYLNWKNDREKIKAEHVFIWYRILDTYGIILDVYNNVYGVFNNQDALPVYQFIDTNKSTTQIVVSGANPPADDLETWLQTFTELNPHLGEISNIRQYIGEANGMLNYNKPATILNIQNPSMMQIQDTKTQELEDIIAMQPNDFGIEQWKQWSYNKYFYLGYFGELAFHVPQNMTINVNGSVQNDALLVMTPRVFPKLNHLLPFHQALEVVFVATKYDLAAFNQQKVFAKVSITKEMAIDAYIDVLSSIGFGHWELDQVRWEDFKELTPTSWRDNFGMDIVILRNIQDVQYWYNNLNSLLGARSLTLDTIGTMAGIMTVARQFGGIHIPFTIPDNSSMMYS